MNIPVRRIRNTSQSIIPSQESGQNAEHTTSDGQTFVGGTLSVHMNEGDGEAEKGEVEGEEEGEECDG